MRTLVSDVTGFSVAFDPIGVESIDDIDDDKFAPPPDALHRESNYIVRCDCSGVKFDDLPPMYRLIPYNPSLWSCYYLSGAGADAPALHWSNLHRDYSYHAGNRFQQHNRLQRSASCERTSGTSRENLSDYRNNRPAAYVTNATTAASSLNDRFLRSSSVVSTSSPPGSGGDSDSVDYKKLYEKEVAENERLRKIIADLEKSIDGIKFGVKQASGDGCHIIPYNHNRIEKLVSELEGENRNLDQIRAENIKLKEENGALIRVISKLSKSK